MKSVVNDVVREEIRSAVLVYADGSCKCADEVAVLKEELQKSQKIIQELTTKLELHIYLPFVRNPLRMIVLSAFYTGLPNLKDLLKAILDHVCIALPSERSAQCKLSRFQEFMVVMLKLRLNVDLSYWYNVSTSTFHFI